MRCCLATDYWATVAVLRCTLVATIIWDLGTVTALVNMVCSCHGCNYCSWKGTHVNHIISLNNWWAHQLGASEWCSNSVLGWLSIKGALPWWDMVIVMWGELGRITECMRSGCHSFRIVSECLWHILWKSMVSSRVGSVMEYVGIIMESFWRYWWWMDKSTNSEHTEPGGSSMSRCSETGIWPQVRLLSQH